MKTGILTAAALALLTALLFTGCDKSGLKDSATTRRNETTSDLGDRIESGLDRASEKVREGLTDASEKLREDMDKADERLSRAMESDTATTARP